MKIMKRALLCVILGILSEPSLPCFTIQDVKQCVQNHKTEIAIGAGVAATAAIIVLGIIFARRIPEQQRAATAQAVTHAIRVQADATDQNGSVSTTASVASTASVHVPESPQNPSSSDMTTTHESIASAPEPSQHPELPAQDIKAAMNINGNSGQSSIHVEVKVQIPTPLSSPVQSTGKIPIVVRATGISNFSERAFVQTVLNKLNEHLNIDAQLFTNTDDALKAQGLLCISRIRGRLVDGAVHLIKMINTWPEMKTLRSNVLLVMHAEPLTEVEGAKEIVLNPKDIGSNQLSQLFKRVFDCPIIHHQLSWLPASDTRYERIGMWKILADIAQVFASSVSVKSEV